MIKIFLTFSILLFSSYNYAIELTTSKAYPPYPSVWGYDLSEHQAIRDGMSGIDAYRMPDGDIWFLFNSTTKYKDPMQPYEGGYKEEKYILLKFFKGEQIELDEDQQIEFAESSREKKLSKLNNFVHFSDGNSLQYFEQSPPKLCLYPQFIRGYFIKKNISSNNNGKKYSILGVNPHVEIWDDKGLCEVKGAPFFYQRLYVLNVLIDLGDDTFITYASGANLIVRFDKNLNTYFKPINPVTTRSQILIPNNVFVIDYTVIEELRGKYASSELPFNQFVHDDLLLYFKEKHR